MKKTSSCNPTPLPSRMSPLSWILLLVFSSWILLDASAEHGPPLPKFICTPMPVDSDPGCSGNGRHSQPATPGSSNAWWGLTDDAKATVLHLRETIVQQKETILDQRETIRELSAKLTLCEGFGTHSAGRHDDAEDSDPHHSNALGHSSRPHRLPEPHSLHGVPRPHHTETHGAKNTMGDPPKHAVSVDQMGRMLQSLKERIDNLQHSRNTSHSLRDLLQRRITALEHQIQHRLQSGGEEEEEEEEEGGDHHRHSEEEDDDHHNHHENDTAHGHHDDGYHGNGHRDNGNHDYGHHDDGLHDNGHRDNGNHDNGHHDDGLHDNGHRSDGHHGNHVPHHRRGVKSRDNHSHASQGHSSHGQKLDAVMDHLPHRNSDKASASYKKVKSPDDFQIGFPMRTNYMYGRVKRTLLQEIFAVTLCLWLKSTSSPGMGTPFSYSVPGQANELVLIEWGNNPMELLVNDKAVTLPLSINDAKWHHVCVTWSTRDGLWESYQDGIKRGTGENLAAWHPIKPGGVFILGQEQDTLGGRFDATQAFVGEMSNVNMWSHVLTPNEIYNLATCGSHATGDVIAWTESSIELHGGVTKYPFDPCH
ncbi:NPTX1 protein, partial [Polyodon spathula]|nr:NPTX1 protein [Polyodon spathula]